MIAIEDVKAHLHKEMARAEKALKAHADMLEKSPVHAFEWADAAFAAAARKNVIEQAFIHLTSANPIERLKNIATDRTLRGARYPARSTSASSNIMAQETSAAWAEIFEILQD
jgi:hypothetical protein